MTCKIAMVTQRQTNINAYTHTCIQMYVRICVFIKVFELKRYLNIEKIKRMCLRINMAIQTEYFMKCC